MVKTGIKANRSDGARSRQKILEAAAELATVEGLNGLSIGNLAEHIGMSKSGLYAHFGSKEELQIATIDAADQRFSAEVLQPSGSPDDPLQHLLALCDNFLSHLERRVFPGGCFFAAALAEFGPLSGRVKERVAQSSRAWWQRLADTIDRAKELGQIPASEDTQQLAFELDAYLLLANTMFVFYEDPQALERARRAFRARLGVDD